MGFDFVKAHGLGNDYIVVDTTLLGFGLTPERIRAICDRHTGVGSDGILAVVEAADADFGLRIYNPDGSEAEKSGNGLRIAARFLSDHGYTRRDCFTIQTRGGLISVRLISQGSDPPHVQVEMGRAVVDATRTHLRVDDRELEVTVVSIGNPHCVVVVEDLSAVDLLHLGPAIENHETFPRRTNVQFVQVLARNEVRALIWERGAGHTLASGSSACAVAAACFQKQMIDTAVTVQMEGGDLEVEILEGLHVIMTGPVEETCAGRFSRDLKRRLLEGEA
jgi:diaminopimelate epimerase